jgi:CheY-like chemotaxis protein/HPt (histidine-containing phosphotransfer) domain-containing protein
LRETLLHFTVRDTGIGIPPEKRASIFAPFTQADGSTTRKYGGTGLGLTISARLVEMMGGHIRVESEVGKGSTISFTARFGVHHAPPAGRSPADQERLRGTRVLVVDDNATNRHILERALAQWGLEPTLAAGGSAALTALDRARTAGRPFALVLIDAMMPEMDGFTLAERVRGRPDTAGLKLVVLTSGGHPGDAARCQALGVAGYLTKPVKQADLWRALLRALDVPAAAAAAIRPAAPVAAADRPLRILLAEDNPMNQTLAVRLLEKRGHTVVVANNGKEALAALERQSYDLVLMDVQMPEMDGLEAATAIRRKEAAAGGHVPIIAMTAFAMKGDRELCLQAGMDAYVSKPMRAADLFAAIASLAPRPADVLNWDEALAHVGGDRDLLRDLAATFLDQAPRWTGAIRAALDGQDADRLKAAAHPLKGSLGTFAAKGAFAAAQRLETLGRQRNLSGGREALDELEREMARLTPALTDLARGR